MHSIQDWCKAAHELAVEKGFYSRRCTQCDGTNMGCINCTGTGRVPVDKTSPTFIASRLAAIHAEVSEAYECVACGRMELYWPEGDRMPARFKPITKELGQLKGWKPEGFPIELADVFLRLCDLAGSLGIKLRERTQAGLFPKGHTPEELSAILCDLHDLLPRARDTDFGLKKEQFRADLNQFAAELFEVASRCNIGLFAMAELKHEYNKTRSVMHGGKLL